VQGSGGGEKGESSKCCLRVLTDEENQRDFRVAGLKKGVVHSSRIKVRSRHLPRGDVLGQNRLKKKKKPILEKSHRDAALGEENLSDKRASERRSPTPSQER